MPERNCGNNARNLICIRNPVYCGNMLSEALYFGKGYSVFILGDLNAPLLTRPGSQQDVLLKQFVETNGLSYIINRQVKLELSENLTIPPL